MNNDKVNIVACGEGDLIVTLHGWGQNLFMMKFIQDALKDQYYVINLDLPGFGNSDPPPTAFSVQDYAEWLHDLIKDYHQSPIIIAHSFGARIALRYAATYGASRLIITGGAGIQPIHNSLYYLRVYSYKIAKFLRLDTSKYGSSDYLASSGIMRAIFLNTINDNIEGILESIDTPTLLVWGDNDHETPLWMGKRMELMLPQATLVQIKGGDHFAYFYHSNKFIRIVEAFLNG